MMKITEKRIKLINELMKVTDYEKYIRNISKAVDFTYCSTVLACDELYSLGYVRFEKTGRIKKVFVTEEGAKVFTLILQLGDKLNQNGNIKTEKGKDC